MANTRISNEAAIVMLNALTGLYNVGGRGYVEIRTGNAPPEIHSSPSGVLLGKLYLSPIAFSPASVYGGVVTANSNTITDYYGAYASGEQGWFRSYNGLGQAVSQGDITEIGGDGDMTTHKKDVEAGEFFNVTTWSIVFS